MPDRGGGELRTKGFGGPFAVWKRERDAEFDRLLAETAAKLNKKKARPVEAVLMGDDRVVPEYRDELFGAQECEEAPFWLSVEAPDGSERSEVDALKVVSDFWGEPTEEPWVVSRVQAYLGRNEYGDLTLHEKPEGKPWGPFAFWKVDEV